MNRTSLFRAPRTVMVGAALTALTLLAPAGQAAATFSNGRTTAEAPTSVGSYQLRFVKRSTTNSTLSIVRNGKAVADFRAGSGTSTSDCVRNEGWLPNGTYTIKGHYTSYNGRLIKGYAIDIGSKKCHNGTPRTELFIHSEMTRSGGQGSTESRRWDGTNDYKSNGCIKMHPEDIKKLFRNLKRNGWPTTLQVIGG
ncbi:L,D-transpeptidase [Streptomyces sp. NPDC050509]|uniref:L,D-transpeptidase n=1 Tax=Streptomyces sp. NPDC050509 TaxID=3365620 RepID=UPI0037A2B7E1